MTQVISADGTVVVNSDTIIDNPALVISGNNVHFTNASDGRVTANAAGVPAIDISGSGAVIINQLGGAITTTQSYHFASPPIVLHGSAFDDRVENFGTIAGLVDLGAGNDTYISSVILYSSTFVSLGAGDDVLVMTAHDYNSYVPTVNANGGDGTDTMIFNGVGANFDLFNVTGFEILEIHSGGFMQGLNGFQQIKLAFGDERSSDGQWDAIRFSDGANTDIAVETQFVDAAKGSTSTHIYDRSSFHSFTGSALSDYLLVANDTSVSGLIKLGAGNDQFQIGSSQFSNPIQHHFGTMIDGGDGNDIFSIQAAVDYSVNLGRQTAVSYAVDLGNVLNFETFDFSSFPFSSVDPNVTLTVSNLGQATGWNGTQTIRMQGNQNLVLMNTKAGGATVMLENGPLLTLDSASVLGSIRASSDTVIDRGAADPSKSVTAINHGRITGDVSFGLGDDYLDSADGRIDGIVYGRGGNDVLIGGDDNDNLDGGSGSDRLYGGGGFNQLNGGDGNDRLFTTGGSHNNVDGGAGTDLLTLGGNSTEYSFLERGGVIYLVGAAETAKISNIEQIQFDDKAVAFADLNATLHAFDPLAYIASHGDLRATLGTDTAAATQHFLLYGYAEGRTVTFDPLAYIAANPDLIAAFHTDIKAAEKHYLAFGAAEQRATTFDALRYIASNPDLISAFGTDTVAAMRHYIEYGFAEKRSMDFDPLSYVAANADLITAIGTDMVAAEKHYITYGANEDRATSFDALRYIASNSDLISAFGTDTVAATQHYIEYGFTEGRSMNFDPLAYGAGYHDLATAIGDDPTALDRHYIQYGFAEGRSANPGFDPVAYLLSYSDLQSAHLGPTGALHHWLQYGADEGRASDSFFFNDQVGHELTTAAPVNASIFYYADHDWFSFTAQAGQTVTLDLSTISLRGALDVSHGDGSYIGSSGSIASGMLGYSHFSFQADTSGTYYVVVHPDYSVVPSGSFGFNSGGSYELNLHLM